MTVPLTTLPSSMKPAFASLSANRVAKSSVSISGVRIVWFSIRSGQPFLREAPGPGGTASCVAGGERGLGVATTLPPGLFRAGLGDRRHLARAGRIPAYPPKYGTRTL